MRQLLYYTPTNRSSEGVIGVYYDWYNAYVANRSMSRLLRVRRHRDLRRLCGHVRPLDRPRLREDNMKPASWQRNIGYDFWRHNGNLIVTMNLEPARPDLLADRHPSRNRWDKTSG